MTERAMGHADPNTLLPYPANARSHTEDQIRQLAASIREFGFTQPVLIDEKGTILAGHGRVEAAKSLGLESIPVITVTDLTDDQKRAYVMADNRLAELSTWDTTLVRTEIQGLLESDYDISLVGFDDGWVTKALDTEPTSPDDDHVPESVDARARPGDLFRCGRHTVLCGDSTLVDDVARAMDGHIAEMLFTDPPYNTAYRGAPCKKRKAIENDGLGDDFEAFLALTLSNAAIYTRGAAYVCFSDRAHEPVMQALKNAGLKHASVIVWAKNHFVIGMSDYHQRYELISYGWKDGSKRTWNGERSESNVWHYDKPVASDMHPTMKPVELVVRAIRNSSKRGHHVLDIFGGSGTTLIAAEKTGRCAHLVEKDPHYVDVIVSRWEQYTGKTATMEPRDAGPDSSVPLPK